MTRNISNKYFFLVITTDNIQSSNLGLFSLQNIILK